MATAVEFEHKVGFIAAFDPAELKQRPPLDEAEAAQLAAYRQIAARRAQIENAEILRRARAL